MFDGADPLGIVPERAATTTTPQALFMMNNPLVSDAGQRLAERLKKDYEPERRPARLASVPLLLGRPPRPEETQIGVAYVMRSSWDHYFRCSCVRMSFCTSTEISGRCVDRAVPPASYGYLTGG